ncbi:HTH-type transcriptional regulator BetI [Streptomyces sp. RB5]|uniref:HTH-type transcriptional regulator BetI n=1 Tax=Streptomyces smaragdinus TaxID=2585196 RepID=A0A7K0CRI0_9ACTN|nr:TetR/AcrR family transcriptional regulator [Streptomyces smaragdinus]MQY16041.1 HTH-type transcriptional regulator BetI [Streptomyces smaragdinus]
MSEKVRRRLPRQVREQQIIDAGMQVFSKRGYHAAVVDEIADLAGISKPMVYLYFGSKEGLFIACIRREGERLTEEFQGAAREGHGAEAQLWAGLTAFFTFVAGHRDGWVVLYRQAPEVGGEVAAEVTRQRSSVMAAVTGLVASSSPGGASEEAEFVAHALVGAADSLTDWMERHPGESPERVTLRLMNMVWIGMRSALRGEVWTPPSGEGA